MPEVIFFTLSVMLFTFIDKKVLAPRNRLFFIKCIAYIYIPTNFYFDYIFINYYLK